MINDCIFCKIVRRDIPTSLVYEGEHVVAFDDIAPIAPVHVLVIPKEHVASLHDVTAAHAPMLAELLQAAVAVAKLRNIVDTGYKVLIRTGKHGGQEVPHVHVHVIGGAPLTEHIAPVQE